VATGQVPFQAYGGRANKEATYVTWNRWFESITLRVTIISMIVWNNYDEMKYSDVKYDT